MFQNAAIVRNAIAAALLLLLGVGILMPVSGGLWLLRHRTARQNTLARCKSSLRPLEITLSDSLAGECFQAGERELEYGGLRYDVVEYHKNGDTWTFKAVPDLKESEIMKASRPVLFPGTVAPVSYGFAALFYLSEHTFEFRFTIISTPHKRAFFNEKVAEMAGFKGNSSPPPEVCRHSFSI